MKPEGVTSIQVADETFVAAAPESVREALGDRSQWARWWPDLELTVVGDRAGGGRAVDGHRPDRGHDGGVCEPVMDGFVLHYFLHGEPTGALPRRPRALYDELARQIAAGGWRQSNGVRDQIPAGAASFPGDQPPPPRQVRQEECVADHTAQSIVISADRT